MFDRITGFWMKILQCSEVPINDLQMSCSNVQLLKKFFSLSLYILGTIDQCHHLFTGSKERHKTPTLEEFSSL